MSVFMILRVQGDANTLEQYASSNAEMMQQIAEAGKAAGAIHHAFAGDDNEIVVIDEWSDEASFQRFFDSQPDIPRLMQEGGATGAPQISFYRKLDTGDEF
jgi:heme-degrading monooxygenase HmoA